MAEEEHGTSHGLREFTHRTGHELGGFEQFILRGNVVDLVVGIVIGAAFGNGPHTRRSLERKNISITAARA